MLTNKDYCDYDTCVALREFGYNYPQRLIPDYFGVFDEPQYDEKIHLYDAQKWLREEKEIIVEIIHTKFHFKNYFDFLLSNTEFSFQSSFGYDSYEEALSEGIKEAVKILKER